jgi:hypothetical protein
MKSRLLKVILSLCLWADGIPDVAAASRFRTTMEVTYQTNGMREIRAEDWGEKRPLVQVADDASWNWGLVSEGVEMAVRFTKSPYAREEPIEYQILVRNISEKPTHFAGGGSPIDDFKITVTDDQNRLIPELRDILPSTETDFQRRLNRSVGKSNAKQFPLHPGTQHIYIIRLEELFDLNRPGRYFVTATHGVPKLDGFGYSEVRSGTAMANLPGSTNQTSLRLATDSNPRISPVQNQQTDASSPRSLTSTSDNATAAFQGTNRALRKPIATTAPTSVPTSSTAARRVGIGILAVLFALVLAIFWRASRRRRI